jgi:hypothetical protein
MTAQEWVIYRLSRIACRFGYHTLTCRGRVDHDPYAGCWTDKW